MKEKDDEKERDGGDRKKNDCGGGDRIDENGDERDRDKNYENIFIDDEDVKTRATHNNHIPLLNFGIDKSPYAVHEILNPRIYYFNGSIGNQTIISNLACSSKNVLLVSACNSLL